MIQRIIAVCLLLVEIVPCRADLICPDSPSDAGTLRTGVALRCRLALRNSGRQPIELLHVKPGCGCLHAQFESRYLLPGQQTTLTVEVSTATQPAGPRSWEAIVHYQQAGEVRQLAVRVMARLVEEVCIRPAALVLHTSGAMSQTVTLREQRDTPLTITAAVLSNPHLRARVEPPVQQGTGWERRIVVEVLPTLPPGRHEDVLHLRSNEEHLNGLKLPLTVVKQAAAGLEAVPGTLQLRAVPGQSVPARIVLLSAREGRPVQIQKVEASHPCLRCTWADGPGNRATLRVQVDANQLPSGDFQGEVLVTPIDATQGKARIAVKVQR